MDRILAFDWPTVSNLLLQLFQTAIMIAFLSRLLYKPVLKFLKDRSARISDQIKSAKDGLEQTQVLKAEYEEKLKNIDKERDEILEAARKQAKAREASIIEAAKAEAEAILKRAASELELEQQKAKDEMKVQLVEISSLIAGRFVAKNMDKATEETLLNQVITDLGDVKWLN